MIGRKIIYKDTLASTNNYVANLDLEGKIEHGTAILAGNQSEGKGQRGAVWDSEPYKNISFSCFLKHDNLAVSQHFILNQVISLSCVDFLNHFKAGFKIKWPNDLVFGTSKIAGILIENQLQKEQIKSSIVGIGVNVNQSEFGAYNATSLALLLDKELDIKDSVLVLIEKLNYWYKKLLVQDFATIQDAYLENLWLLQQKSSFEDSEGEFEGKILGVDSSGQLEVKKTDSIKKYQHKEIVFLERSL